MAENRARLRKVICYFQIRRWTIRLFTFPGLWWRELPVQSRGGLPYPVDGSRFFEPSNFLFLPCPLTKLILLLLSYLTVFWLLLLMIATASICHIAVVETKLIATMFYFLIAKMSNYGGKWPQLLSNIHRPKSEWMFISVFVQILAHSSSTSIGVLNHGKKKTLLCQDNLSQKSTSKTRTTSKSRFVWGRRYIFR